MAKLYTLLKMRKNFSRRRIIRINSELNEKNAAKSTTLIGVKAMVHAYKSWLNF